ncbi:hypothetical protein HN011_008465 [Eciton burchellii]|nr:hypothetical protein HN011_008465 [Eciton burchellii]
MPSLRIIANCGISEARYHKDQREGILLRIEMENCVIVVDANRMLKNVPEVADADVALKCIALRIQPPLGTACMCAFYADVTSLHKCEASREERPDITSMKTPLFSLPLLLSGGATFVSDDRHDFSALDLAPFHRVPPSPVGLLRENSAGRGHDDRDTWRQKDTVDTER